MIYTFFYNERENFFPIYEKILISRKVFFGNHQEWLQALRVDPQEDRYDRDWNPFYIVSIEEATGTIASVRVLPTTGPTMLRQDFARYFPGCPDIISPDVWELSWFCTTADTASPVGRNLMLDVLKTLCDYALANGVKQVIGTYPQSRLRLYRRLKISPSVIRCGDINGHEFCVSVLDINLLTLRHLTELRLSPF
ncbi:acyl-homoserine-lactone synthase [Acetobacter orleanensis]|uniref:Acyl-homoserine-lactone synthase n=1 Tax=Acetobacter orleanensis TaxID=104099 RepID=A0A4Y3TLT7_9PROT|nr:acyl-homoserine-lactone synthase [Acetobacter orleanensis]KXV62483.1 hypothetical protein AD949_10120 [Acetobacter orleanensis]PCD80089.1 hypothetical protein CO710_04370 [Acetobacter orleanensis]GAN68421.1 autoinducer synthesis protein [Acetobacter orleanensis JCM 7639]GBR22684.1 autoinducer synthesis protein [Acetobacter orleanensis NRIC 0473]GEB82734.1 hypothetical protein AOR01nite_12110 [Acetobacter orleanensis]